MMYTDRQLLLQIDRCRSQRGAGVTQLAAHSRKLVTSSSLLPESVCHLVSTVSLSSHCLKGRCSSDTCSNPPAEAMSGSPSPSPVSPG